MPKGHNALPKLRPLELDGHPLDINYFLTTDYVDSVAASKELPAVIEFVNENLQFALENKLRWKSTMERARSKAFLDLRGPLWDSRGIAAKQTDKSVEAAVELEEPVIEAQEQFIIFSGLVSRLSRLIEVLHAKLDIIRTSEATRRAMLEESDTKPSEE